MASLQLGGNSSATLELEQMMNASLNMIHQQINDLAGKLNASIKEIQVREDEKQQITNASLDILYQQMNDLFSFYPTSCAAVLQLYSSSPSGYSMNMTYQHYIGRKYPI